FEGEAGPTRLTRDALGRRKLSELDRALEVIGMKAEEEGGGGLVEQQRPARQPCEPRGPVAPCHADPLRSRRALLPLREGPASGPGRACQDREIGSPRNFPDD